MRGRFARVATSDIEARLGAELARVVNVSATGALLRTNAPFLVGRSCPLLINAPQAPISLKVKIVRTEPQLVGVMFTEFTSAAKQGIARLCGSSFNQHE